MGYSQPASDEFGQMPVDHVDDVEGGFPRELDDQGVVVLAARRVAVVDLDLGEFLEFGDALLHEADAVGPTVEVERFSPPPPRASPARRARPGRPFQVRHCEGVSDDSIRVLSWSTLHRRPRRTYAPRGTGDPPSGAEPNHNVKPETLSRVSRFTRIIRRRDGRLRSPARRRNGSRRSWRRRCYRFAIPTLQRSNNPQTTLHGLTRMEKP